MRLAAALLALAMALSAGVAGATSPCPNEIGNGDFSLALGTTGWQTSIMDPGVQVLLVASPNDRLGSPTSRAGRVFNQSAGAGADVGTAPLPYQACFALAPGDAARVGGWIQVPSAQSATGFAQLVVAWYSDSQCIGFLGYGSTLPLVSIGPWFEVDDVLAAPLGANSVGGLALAVSKNEAGSIYSAYYDDLFQCVPEPGPGAAGLTAAGALACAYRRRGVGATLRA